MPSISNQSSRVDSGRSSAGMQRCMLGRRGRSFVLVCVMCIMAWEIMNILVVLCFKFYSSYFGRLEGLPVITDETVICLELPSILSLVVAMLAIAALKERGSCLILPFEVHQIVILLLYYCSLLMYTGHPRELKKDLNNTLIAQLPRLQEMILEADTDTLAAVCVGGLTLAVCFRLMLVPLTAFSRRDLHWLEMHAARNTAPASGARNKDSRMERGLGVSDSRDKADYATINKMDHYRVYRTAMGKTDDPKVGVYAVIKI